MQTRAITVGQGIQLRVVKGDVDSQHSHAPNREEVHAEMVKAKLKVVADQHPELKPGQILHNELHEVPSCVLALLPERENLKKSIRRVRRGDLPVNPVTLNEFQEIPNKYTKTLQGENVLLFDSFNDCEEKQNRVIMFETRQNLEILFKSHIWFLGGTFKVSPNIFTQIFIIIGLAK